MIFSFRVFLLTALVACAVSFSAHAQSFACALAQTPTERAICNARDLQLLDEELDRSYRAVLVAQAAQSDALRRRQRAWIDVRNTCGADIACLAEAYSARISTLTPRVRVAWAGVYTDGFDEVKITIRSVDDRFAIGFIAAAASYTCGPVEAVGRAIDDRIEARDGSGVSIAIARFGTGIVLTDEPANARLRSENCGARAPVLAGMTLSRRTSQ